MPLLLCEGPCSGAAIKHADDILKRGHEFAKEHVDEINALYRQARITDHVPSEASINLQRCVECGFTRRWGRSW